MTSYFSELLQRGLREQVGDNKGMIIAQGCQEQLRKPAKVGSLKQEDVEFQVSLDYI